MYFYALRARPSAALWLCSKSWSNEPGDGQLSSGCNKKESIMKQDRHSAIRELVAGAPIGSQDELRRRLVKRGFEVTQATLSRDIHELHLYKGPNGYSVPNGVALEEEDDLPGTAEMLRSFGLRVKQALNQLVLITTSGSAQPVALAID